MIIGVTGMLGAGKSVVAEYLVKSRSFTHLSVRDYLTEEVKKRGLPINRDSMVFVANDLRKNFGSGYIAEQLYDKAVGIGGDCVIESLRSVGEVEILRKKGDFILLGVDADITTRYSRVVERGSSTDQVSFERFVSDEQRESTLDDPSKGNLRRCIEMADYKFMNDWTVAELEGKVDKVLSQLSGEGLKINDSSRLTWDEYFMDICRAVAKRATCDRGKSGCVIAKDKHILVTGYVGSPIGLPHCDDVGHHIEDTVHSDGVKRSHCIRTTHAEQNAICQAAKFGIPIQGSTLYCKMEPCSVCAKMIINSGVRRVVCEKRYQSGAQSLLEEAGVLVEVLVDEVEKY